MIATIPERPVVLLGGTVGCVTVVDYAEQHPDDVAALVLWNPEGTAADGFDAWFTLLEGDWDADVRLFAKGMTDGSPEEVSRAYVKMARQSVDKASGLAGLRASADTLANNSCADLYGRVQHPTLVIYRRDSLIAKNVPLLACEISDVRQVALEGTAGPYWCGDTAPAGAAIGAFLDDVLPDHADRAFTARQFDVLRQPGAVPGRPQDKLTPREVEVLHLVALGRTNPQIADHLVISPGTATRHVSNILKKARLHNRTELARYAIAHGLLD